MQPSELLGSACLALSELRLNSDKYGDPRGNREELPLALVRLPYQRLRSS